MIKRVLKVTVKKLPQKPGVYLFRDLHDKVLYVGKAINLQKRVKNYFSENKVDFKTKRLLENADKVDFIETKSELESLLLEARLIKQYRPRYNIRLKDDKRYLYAGFTKEPFPRLVLLRQPEKELGLLNWFGPFPSSYALKEILRLVRRIFPYRTCQKMLAGGCLYYHLGLCPGMCRESVKNYGRTVKNLSLLLGGQTDQLVRLLTKRMQQAATAEKYETAAVSKRQLQLMARLWQNYRRFPETEKIIKQLETVRQLLVCWQGFDPLLIHRLEAYDIANLGKDVVVGAMTVLLEGEPDNQQYRQFKIRGEFQGDPPALRQVISRRLHHRRWVYPQVILVDGGKGQVAAAFQALAEKKLIGQIGLIGLAKQEEVLVIPRIDQEKIVSWKLVASLPILQQARDEAHRFAQRYYKKLHRRITFD